MQPDWNNRSTDTHAGWVNELLTLADHHAGIPGFARHAMRTIARGLTEQAADAVEAMQTARTRFTLLAVNRQNTIVDPSVGADELATAINALVPRVVVEYAEEGQWWLKELDALAANTSNPELVRAVLGVLRRLMRQHTYLANMVNGRVPVQPIVVDRFERGQWWLRELEAAVATSEPTQPNSAMGIVYSLMDQHTRMVVQTGATYDNAPG